MPLYSIGIEFRTSGVNALVVRLNDGIEIAVGTAEFAKGVLDWGDPLAARQDPADYFDATDEALKAAVAQASTNDLTFKKELVVGLGFSAPVSTPVPMDAVGVPLAARPFYRKNGYAMAWLPKDTTSYIEAQAITELLKNEDGPILALIGGIYRCSDYWAKIAHCAKVVPEVYDLCTNFAELQDLIPAFLTGTTFHAAMRRGAGAAGHSGLFNSIWGGFPPTSFLEKKDPKLVKVRMNLPTKIYPLGTVAGSLTQEHAYRTGLRAGIPVSVGGMDACLAAVAAGVDEGSLVIHFGEQTSFIASSDPKFPLPNLSGIASAAIDSGLPGRAGILSRSPSANELFDRHLGLLDTDPADVAGIAGAILPGATGLLARDWMIIPRVPDPIIGQGPMTQPEEILRALIEASAFGARRLIEKLRETGILVKEIIACGDVPQPLMTVYASVCNCPVKTHRSQHPAALGAAMAGGVAASAFNTFYTARQKFGGIAETIYIPDPKSVAIYDKLFGLYTSILNGADPASVVSDLAAIKTEATTPVAPAPSAS